ncbi:hypothetical protein PAPYR_8534 [Paratrimastix pyriformis]|uniref:RING-type E3 ubiquitin transferase n=1 Tax=Paratrimastix pyriformis TaxID=342808 RepID=A0ABQ8UAG5_9EUKA|nr:hypothetical protein PAPYR_8534 [Paratrimastix pyriformis]
MAAEPHGQVPSSTSERLAQDGFDSSRVRQLLSRWREFETPAARPTATTGTRPGPAPTSARAHPATAPTATPGTVTGQHPAAPQQHLVPISTSERLAQDGFDSSRIIIRPSQEAVTSAKRISTAPLAPAAAPHHPAAATTTTPRSAAPPAPPAPPASPPPLALTPAVPLAMTSNPSRQQQQQAAAKPVTVPAVATPPAAPGGSRIRNSPFLLADQAAKQRKSTTPPTPPPTVFTATPPHASAGIATRTPGVGAAVPHDHDHAAITHGTLRSSPAYRPARGPRPPRTPKPHSQAPTAPSATHSIQQPKGPRSRRGPRSNAPSAPKPKPPRAPRAPRLPIMGQAQAIKALLSSREQKVVIVHGQTGVGKSTFIPQLAAEVCTPENTSVLVVHPLEALLKARHSGDGVIVTMSPGAAARHVMTDPQLMGGCALLRRSVGVLVIDDAHQRTADIDLLLALGKKLAETRQDFHLVVVLPEPQVDPAFALFLRCPPEAIVAIAGPRRPPKEQWHPNLGSLYSAAHLVATLSRFLRKTWGNVIVFVPSTSEAYRVKRQLERNADLTKKRVVKMVVDLPRGPPPPGKKTVLLCTHEASATMLLPDVTLLVDCGCRTIWRVDPSTKRPFPETVPIAASTMALRALLANGKSALVVRLFEQTRFGDREEASEVTSGASDRYYLMSKRLGLTEDDLFSQPNRLSLIVTDPRWDFVNALGLTDRGRLFTNLYLSPKATAFMTHVLSRYPNPRLFWSSAPDSAARQALAIRKQPFRSDLLFALDLIQRNNLVTLTDPKQRYQKCKELGIDVKALSKLIRNATEAEAALCLLMTSRPPQQPMQSLETAIDQALQISHSRDLIELLVPELPGLGARLLLDNDHGRKSSVSKSSCLLQSLPSPRGAPRYLVATDYHRTPAGAIILDCVHPLSNPTLPPGLTPLAMAPLPPLPNMGEGLFRRFENTFEHQARAITPFVTMWCNVGTAEVEIRAPTAQHVAIKRVVDVVDYQLRSQYDSRRVCFGVGNIQTTIVDGAEGSPPEAVAHSLRVRVPDPRKRTQAIFYSGSSEEEADDADSEEDGSERDNNDAPLAFEAILKAKQGLAVFPNGDLMIPCDSDADIQEILEALPEASVVTSDHWGRTVIVSWQVSCFESAPRDLEWQALLNPDPAWIIRSIDPSRRRVDLPTVKAATDFIARVAALHPPRGRLTAVAQAEVYAKNRPGVCDLRQLSAQIASNPRYHGCRCEDRPAFEDHLTCVTFTGQPRDCVLAARDLQSQVDPIRFGYPSGNEHLYQELRPLASQWASELGLELEGTSKCGRWSVHGPGPRRNEFMTRIRDQQADYLSRVALYHMQPSERAILLSEAGHAKFCRFCEQHSNVQCDVTMAKDAASVEIYFPPQPDAESRRLQDAIKQVDEAFCNLMSELVGSERNMVPCVYCHDPEQTTRFFDRCGHPYCEQCLKKELVRGTLPLRCPKCRTRIACDDLEASDGWARLVDRVLAKKLEDPSSPFCKCPNPLCQGPILKRSGWTECPGCLQFDLLAARRRAEEELARRHEEARRSQERLRQERLATLVRLERIRLEAVERKQKAVEFEQSCDRYRLDFFTTLITAATRWTEENWTLAPAVLHPNPGLAKLCPAAIRFLRQAGSPLDLSRGFFAWHGTSDAAVDAICWQGFDPRKRGSAVGQARGRGEYFGITCQTSAGYCHGGSHILVAFILRDAAPKVIENFCYVVDNPVNWETSYCLPIAVVSMNGKVPTFASGESLQSLGPLPNPDERVLIQPPGYTPTAVATAAPAPVAPVAPVAVAVEEGWCEVNQADFQWSWNDDSGPARYQDDVNGRIETMYELFRFHRGQQRVVVGDLVRLKDERLQIYTIDFEKMQQFNERTGFTRRVTRERRATPPGGDPTVQWQYEDQGRWFPLESAVQPRLNEALQQYRNAVGPGTGIELRVTGCFDTYRYDLINNAQENTRTRTSRRIRRVVRRV